MKKQITLDEKPMMSNQHGALVMAFIPYFYGISASHWVNEHFWLGLTWIFLYLFSYPFFSLFHKKQKEKYQKWAMIYAILAGLSALPLLIARLNILQFFVWILPLVAIQIYYAKKRDERNLINTISAIISFGIIGMASFYLAAQQYNFAILFHPSLFFMATTLYIKSVARERKNPRYLTASIELHWGIFALYVIQGALLLSLAYFIAGLRATIVPTRKLTIKQIGLLEFPIITLFFLCLIFSNF